MCSKVGCRLVVCVWWVSFNIFSMWFGDCSKVVRVILSRCGRLFFRM